MACSRKRTCTARSISASNAAPSSSTAPARCATSGAASRSAATPRKCWPPCAPCRHKPRQHCRLIDMAQRIFVLDTNVLMHDPTALFRFHEHDIFVPMLVLEELDGGKKGLSEVARNVRQVSRFIDELIHDKSHAEIEAGLAINSSVEFADEHDMPVASGRLFFETRPPEATLPGLLPGNKADNHILLSALALRNNRRHGQAVLVSKDINLRIKAALIGLTAQDYYNDKVLDDLDLLYTGHEQLPHDFWETHGQTMDSWQEDGGRTFYRLPLPQDKPGWHVNELL